MTAALHRRVSLNLVSGWGWTLDEHLAFLAREGIGAISVTTRNLEGEGAIGAIRAAGVQVVSVGTGVGSLIEGPQAALARLEPVIAAAAALGSPTAFTVTGPTPPRMATDLACDLLVQALGPVAEHARTRGVRLAIEHSSIATRELGFVCTLADACAVAAEADLGVIVELQNCWCEGAPARLFRQHAPRLAVVQCNDFRLGEDPRRNRRVPGDGDMPLEWLLGALLDAGYAGMFDLELLGPAIEAEGYAGAMRRGVDWLSERLTRWGV